jgi:hypothetical protein
MLSLSACIETEIGRGIASLLDDSAGVLFLCCSDNEPDESLRCRAGVGGGCGIEEPFELVEDRARDPAATTVTIVAVVVVFEGIRW